MLSDGALGGPVWAAVGRGDPFHVGTRSHGARSARAAPRGNAPRRREGTPLLPDAASARLSFRLPRPLPPSRWAPIGPGSVSRRYCRHGLGAPQATPRRSRPARAL